MEFRRVCFAAVAVLALALVWVAPVLAEDGAPVVPSLPSVLAMLASGVGVGAVLAFMFEKIEWFQSLPSNARWWVILGLSIGLPVAAQAALQFVPAQIWAAIEPYWKAVATGFLIWAGSQLAHKLDLRLP